MLNFGTDYVRHNVSRCQYDMAGIYLGTALESDVGHSAFAFEVNRISFEKSGATSTCNAKNAIC